MKKNVREGRSKLPSGAEWGQSSLQPKVNTSKLFVKNLKAPSAQGAVNFSHQKKPYKVRYKKCQTLREGVDNL
jgi:hypothetical protein